MKGKVVVGSIRLVGLVAILLLLSNVLLVWNDKKSNNNNESSATIIENKNINKNKQTGRSLRVLLDPHTTVLKRDSRRREIRVNEVFNLPPSANDWCYPSTLPPLPYQNCDKDAKFNALPLFGGLTNALKMILLGVIHSYEDHNRCFFINQTDSELGKQHILERYFEPIGLNPQGPAVQRAIQEHRVQERTWQELWDEHRQMQGTVLDLPMLNYYKVEGHGLKRNMLRRMWRPKDNVRRMACLELEQQPGLSQDFMVFSVRRGDKTEENMSFATSEQYIERAQHAIDQHFGGKVPTIFVATDSCLALSEFRILKPHWTFVSPCDKQQEEKRRRRLEKKQQNNNQQQQSAQPQEEEEEESDGFALRDVANWSSTETDDHYNKFFVELFAMAAAKVFIGVWYTNVSWWAFFMRNDVDTSTFILLDTPGKPQTLPFTW